MGELGVGTHNSTAAADASLLLETEASDAAGVDVPNRASGGCAGLNWAALKAWSCLAVGCTRRYSGRGSTDNVLPRGQVYNIVASMAHPCNNPIMCYGCPECKRIWGLRLQVKLALHLLHL